MPIHHPLLPEEEESLQKWRKTFGVGSTKGLQEDQPFNDDFTSEDVLEWWLEVEDYQLSTPVTILLPCAKATKSNKVIQDSVTHKNFAKVLTRWNPGYLEHMIISEPLTIIPYDRRDYPKYNYPPPLLRLEDTVRRRPRDYHLFVTRLQLWLERQSHKHLWTWFGSSREFHHPRILQAAWTLKEPLFCVVPSGGIRDISSSALCLRTIIEKAWARDLSNSLEELIPISDKSRFFVVTKERRRIYPSYEYFIESEVDLEPFCHRISETMRKLQNTTI